MELQHINGQPQRLDECNNVDWGYHIKNPKAYCYENHCVTSALSPDQYESISLATSDEVSCPKLSQENHGKEKRKVCCVEELETSFTYIDENVNIEHVAHPTFQNGHRHQHLNSDGEIQQDRIQEVSIMSDDEATSEASGKSVDYGFISAVTFLITGILLVIISYLFPRDTRSDPNSITAREMEKIEKKNAIIGAHLDRCVIAGLCLLTLGGVVLSVLLMISMWKGELYRRKAFASKDSAKLYGSINFNHSKSEGAENTLVQEETIDIVN
ncbi:transmembrane protein 74 [Phyllobates terribilis]|uniref:transmembrane protein 74 n=1 Tax=Phyllobates terribilis TaxID=111132 RepID=UPI003CCB6A1A